MAPRPDATPRKCRSVPATWHASPVSGSASASTAAASARSRLSLPSCRAISTPPTSRTSTSTTTSERVCRLTSSTETRRCLVKELEVFNMADDDEAVSPALETTPMKETSWERGALVKGMGGERNDPEETDDPDMQCDAWAVDDWATASQSSLSARTSPCSSARGMARAQREVADAVLSDLQIDLQAQVHRAISEMSSWISEEVTFARQQYQESMETTNCQVNELWRKERLDMQTTQNELRCEVDRLHARLEEQIQAMAKLQEEASCRTFQMNGPQPSANVMEARLVAEERKWRLKLEELQDGLANHHQRIGVLDAQSSKILGKLATRDVELIREQMEELHQNVGKHVPRIDKLDAMCNSLRETVALHENRLEKVLDSQNGEIETCTRMIQNLAKETGDLARQLATNDAQVSENSTQLNGISAQLTTIKQEHLDEFDAVAKETMGCVRKITEIDERTLEISSQLINMDTQWNNGKVARLAELQAVHDHMEKHEASLGSFRSEVRTHVCSMKERLDKAVSDLSREIRRKQAELSEQLGSRATVAELQEIRDAVEGWVENARQVHQLAMQGLASSLERVASTSLEHGNEIRKHQNYMKDLSQWINEGVSRDECMTEVLLHIVEEDYPDLMAVLERRLQAASAH